MMVTTRKWLVPIRGTPPTRAVTRQARSPASGARPRSRTSLPRADNEVQGAVRKIRGEPTARAPESHERRAQATIPA